MNQKYYIVQVKCGHVGKNFFILKSLPVVACNGKEAANIARNTPRVKHDHKDAIRNVKEVSLETYEIVGEKISRDPYFNTHNIQDEKRYCIDIDLKKKREIVLDDYFQDKRETRKKAYDRRKVKFDNRGYEIN